jgi:hypothetical protein
MSTSLPLRSGEGCVSASYRMVKTAETWELQHSTCMVPERADGAGEMGEVRAAENGPSRRTGI